MDFEKALELDLYHLDQSYLDLPKLTEEWNAKAVEVEIAALNAKNALDDKRAFLDKDIREFQGNYGLTGIKLTEGIVSSEINANPDVKKLTEEYFNHLIEHKRLKSKCASITTIEKSLQGLTKLYEAGYFASKPICAMGVTQETESQKLNTTGNINKIKNAKKGKV